MAFFSVIKMALSTYLPELRYHFLAGLRASNTNPTMMMDGDFALIARRPCCLWLFIEQLATG